MMDKIVKTTTPSVKYSPAAGFNQPPPEQVTAQHKVVAGGGGVTNLDGQAKGNYSSEQQQQ